MAAVLLAAAVEEEMVAKLADMEQVRGEAPKVLETSDG
jgi:hypothetical protein